MAAGFLFDKSDNITKGKGLAALKNSRRARSELIAMFGGRENLPSSVMRAEKTRVDASVDKHGAERQYSSTGQWAKLSEEEKAKIPPELRRGSYGISGRGCGAGALSTFPQNIGRTVVLLYSEPGQTVFDPFAGHNSRMELCVKAGRHYIGCDLSNAFMEFNFKRAAQLRKEYRKTNIELHHGDSREIPVEDEVGDFTLTSPPYYDIEDYGDEPEQLGKNKTYRGFLKGMGKVIRENYRILKPGAYAVYFINDFRRKGVFHPYHMDIANLGMEAGFIFHDIMVVDFGRGFRDCFTQQIVDTRIIPKRHEYGVVFLKPTGQAENEDSA